MSAPAIFKDRDLLRIPDPPAASDTLRDQVIQNTVRLNRSAGEGYHQLTDMLARVKDATKQVDRLVGALKSAAS